MRVHLVSLLGRVRRPASPPSFPVSRVSVCARTTRHVHRITQTLVTRGIPVRLVPNVILGHENMKILEEQFKVLKTI